MPLFDRKDKSRYATFTRRALVMSGGMTAVLCALGGRLYQLQITDGDLYRTAAEDNRVNERLVARYIEEVTFRRPLSQGYIWPTRLW